MHDAAKRVVKTSMIPTVDSKLVNDEAMAYGGFALARIERIVTGID